MFTIEPHIQGLIFDCDGTLADTMPLHYQAWQNICQHHQVTFPEQLFYDLAGVPSDRIVTILNQRYGYQLHPTQIAEQKEACFINLLSQAKPIEPIVALAKAYKNRLPMAVATGGVRDVIHLVLRAIDLENFFDAIVTADDVENGKPAPDTYLEAARRIKIAPTYCQVFEDSDLGLEGARKAGMVVTDVRHAQQK